MPRRVLERHDPRLIELRQLAAAQGDVVSRRQVYASGLTRWHIRGQVRAGRWATMGDQSVCLHRVAAVRGALWAVSDRQATLLLTMTVQQGIVPAEDIGIELLRIRRDKRRSLLHAVVLDLLDGAGSLGELDVARLLRQRGLPPPDRQVLRCDGRRRYYLDLYWRTWKLVVEIDGIQHARAENVVGDALGQNALSIDGDTVLRLPLLGLRLAADDFLDQIEGALVARGWSRAA